MANKFFILIILLSVIFSCMTHEKYDYTYINETTNHSYDESVMQSIYAAGKRTGIDNAVIITDSLTSTEFQSAGTHLFKKLNIGKNNQGKGILYLYSPKLQVLKIEVGYALEGKLPDRLVSSLEKGARSWITTDHYQHFWAELINTLNMAVQSQQDHSYDFSNFEFLSGGAGIISGVPTEVTSAEYKTSYCSFPDECANTYIESLGKGIYSSNHHFLSEESKQYRTHTAVSSFALKRNYDMYQKAKGRKLIQNENTAIVCFAQDNPVLPIILVKRGGSWKIHEPLSWALFQRFEDSNSVFLKFPIKNFDELKIYGTPLYDAEAIDWKEITSPVKSTNPLERFFKVYDIEGIASDKSSRTELLWPKLDAYLNLGRVSDFLETYKQLHLLNPNNNRIKRNYEFYKSELDFAKYNWRHHL